MIEQILDTLTAQGAAFDATYFRTSDQYEIDLVLDFGNERWAIEIKLTTAPSPRDLARLVKAAEWIGAERRFLVSRTKRKVEGRQATSCDLPDLLALLAARGGA